MEERVKKGAAPLLLRNINRKGGKDVPTIGRSLFSRPNGTVKIGLNDHLKDNKTQRLRQMVVYCSINDLH